jgi:hypothetical protein
MRLLRMSTRGWMILVAALALLLAAQILMVHPISWDLRERARDNGWLKEQFNEGPRDPS